MLVQSLPYLVGELPRVVAGAPDSKLLHPMAEGVGVEIQDFSCALWSLDHSARLLKSGKDMTALYLLQG